MQKTKKNLAERLIEAEIFHTTFCWCLQQGAAHTLQRIFSPQQHLHKRTEELEEVLRGKEKPLCK